MSHVDVMLGRLQADIDEKRAFQDQLIAAAQSEGRDLKPEELSLYERSTDAIKLLEAQLNPLREGARIGAESARRSAEIADAMAIARNPALAPRQIEYRSAGAYIVDHWRAGVGHEESKQRLDLYLRAAAHQTTDDNLGIIPEPIVGPVLNFIDASRPIVSALGVNPVPGGRFTRPKVTQHTMVGEQTAQKTELASQKMLISDIPVDMATYGGYVNVSRQNIDWSSPNIFDLVVQDLAGQYAITTEGVAAALLAASPVAGPTLPASPTPGDVSAALWEAAALAFTATKGMGRLIAFVSPDMLGLVGPLFAPINPQNAYGSGFSAGSFGTGVMGAVSGISVVMSAALATGTILVVSTPAVELFEQRVGALQVTEPSVLGVQVAYAGYFAGVEIEGDGIVKITAS